MHIEYIAQFCEAISILVGLWLMTYIRVIGATASTYYTSEEMLRLWSAIWKMGNGINYHASSSASVVKLKVICLPLAFHAYTLIYVLLIA